MQIVPKKFLGYTVYRVKKAIQQVEINRLSNKNYDSGKEDKNMAAIAVTFVFGILAYDMYKVICEK